MIQYTELNGIRERERTSPEVRGEVVLQNVMNDSLTIIPILSQTALARGGRNYQKYSVSV